MMKIKFIKEVIFRDQLGNVLKIYSVGDEIEFFSKNTHYYQTAMGGIYFDEAAEI